MKNITFETLNEIFSKARISPYLKNEDNAEKVLFKYHLNIALSEAMIPILHYFEICFRNRVDQIINEYYSSNWLIDLPNSLLISDQDVKKIKEVISKIRRGNKGVCLHDDIVGQMTFGFWCSFFHRKYDPIIWHRKDAIKTMFPNLRRMHRKRSYLEDKIFKIKDIRNRIAHHEPIWDREVLLFEAYTMCHEFLQAMSQDAADMLKTIDRFPSVYSINFP